MKERVIPIWRYQSGRPVISDTDSVSEEEPLAIRVNHKTINITMRTPGHDEELALGFLYSEGIIRRQGDVYHSEKPEGLCNQIDIELSAQTHVDFEKLSRNVFASSSCGLCGKTAIDRVRLPFDPICLGPVVPANAIMALPRLLQENQDSFRRTGGLHAAAVFDGQGQLQILREDIGRHNAVDKILGYGYLRGLIPFSQQILMVSGRASFEIMQKAAAGGFPIVVAVSAPSSLAVQFALESRQTLVGFLRKDRMNIYSHKERIHYHETEDAS